MTGAATDDHDPAVPPPTGPVEERDAAGIVRRRYTLSGGALQGVMQTFAADGMPETRMSFHDGQLHGPATIFQSGRIAVEMTYVQGLLQGQVRSFDPAGRLTAVTGFLAGKRSGETLIFRPEGTLLRRETWRDDQLHGLVEEFNPDGSLLRQSTYVANLLHGEVWTYGPDGGEPERVVFDKGVAQGSPAPLAVAPPQKGWRERLFGKKE